MSLALVYSRNAELQATEVLIEVHLSNGLPAMKIVVHIKPILLLSYNINYLNLKIRYSNLSNCKYTFFSNL